MSAQSWRRATWRRATTILLISSVLGACTEPGSQSGEVAEPDSPPGAAARPTGEQLLALAPAGWQQVLSLDRPGLRMAEYVPSVAGEDGWSEKISVESLAGQPLPDPIEFVNALSEDQQGTCEGFEAFSTFSGEENGYPTTVHLLVCHYNKLLDVSQVTMIKAIQGNQYFYVISRSKRGPPLADESSSPISETEVAGWTLYLRAISVCDASNPAHACPG